MPKIDITRTELVWPWPLRPFLLLPGGVKGDIILW